MPARLRACEVLGQISGTRGAALSTASLGPGHPQRAEPTLASRGQAVGCGSAAPVPLSTASVPPASKGPWSCLWCRSAARGAQPLLGRCSGILWLSNCVQQGLLWWTLASWSPDTMQAPSLAPKLHTWSKCWFPQHAAQPACKADVRPPPPSTPAPSAIQWFCLASLPHRTLFHIWRKRAGRELRAYLGAGRQGADAPQTCGGTAAAPAT